LAIHPDYGIIPKMSITATVENNSIKLPPGVNIPDGTEVTIETTTTPIAPPSPQETLAKRYAEFIGIWEDGPCDLAAEHDHYASTAPKHGA
jgi:hypothetical protein